MEVRLSNRVGISIQSASEAQSPLRFVEMSGKSLSRHEDVGSGESQTKCSGSHCFTFPLVPGARKTGLSGETLYRKFKNAFKIDTLFCFTQKILQK